MCIGTSIVEEG